jgi:hypothetical protein
MLLAGAEGTCATGGSAAWEKSGGRLDGAAELWQGLGNGGRNRLGSGRQWAVRAFTAVDGQDCDNVRALAWFWLGPCCQSPMPRISNLSQTSLQLVVGLRDFGRLDRVRTYASGMVINVGVALLLFFNWKSLSCRGTGFSWQFCWLF